MHGKTTILRDIIRSISTGMEEIHFKGMNIGLVDERGEIAALYKGIPQNDIGVRTDVLDNTPKSIGIRFKIEPPFSAIKLSKELGGIVISSEFK